MGGTMNTNQSRRQGISLLEVIACTALVAVMIIPISGVIRSSGRAISQSNGSTSKEASLRIGLRWLQAAVRDGSVVNVRPRQLGILQMNGDAATIRISRGNLVVETGQSQFVLAEDVRDVRFSELTQLAPPNNRTGISISLQAQDPTTGQRVAVASTVAIPPQL